MLYVKDAPKQSLVVRGARVLDPVEGVDGQVDVKVDDGVIAELGSNLAVNGHRVLDGSGLVSPRRSSIRMYISERRAARTRKLSQPARRPLPPAATARSSRCRTPSRSSTRRRCSAR